MKKVLSSTHDAILSDIRVALRYFGRRSLQKQGRAAHILLCYEPTYTTFSAAENIPIPKGEDSLIALILSDFKNLRQVGFEGSDSERNEVADIAESDQSETESEEVLDSADPPFTSGPGNLPSADVFQRLEDLPVIDSADMAGLSLTKLAKKANAERLAARRRAEGLSTEPPTSESQHSLLVTESESLGIVEERQQTRVPNPRWLGKPSMMLRERRRNALGIVRLV